jgi:hypothetical protein
MQVFAWQRIRYQLCAAVDGKGGALIAVTCHEVAVVGPFERVTGPLRRATLLLLVFVVESPATISSSSEVIGEQQAEQVTIDP